MEFVGTLLQALATMLDLLLTLYLYIIIGRAVISWVNPDPYNPIVQFLFKATEPVLSRIRSLIPMNKIGLDLSPIIAMFAVIIVQQTAVTMLHQFAMRMTH
jgi:YggT family protein